jgi:hypothetical protein
LQAAAFSTQRNQILDTDLFLLVKCHFLRIELGRFMAILTFRGYHHLGGSRWGRGGSSPVSRLLAYPGKEQK